MNRSDTHSVGVGIRSGWGSELQPMWRLRERREGTGSSREIILKPHGTSHAFQRSINFKQHIDMVI